MPAREIYLIVREEVEGPFTLEEIHHQIAIGRIAPDLLCAEHGSTEWKPVATLLDELEEMLHT
jgi:hypothetical protein